MSNRIRYYRKKQGLTQVELASMIHVAHTSISKYELGEVPLTEGMIERLCSIFKCTPTQLLGYDINLDSDYQVFKNSEVNKNTFLIPVLNCVHAGMPTLINDDNVVDYLEVEKSYKSLGEVFALKIKGDSMSPRMYDGDLVIVQRTCDVSSGEIAIVLVNGNEATIKQVRKSANGIMLIPFNPAYEPLFYTNDEIMTLPVVVIGKVIELRATNFFIK